MKKLQRGFVPILQLVFATVALVAVPFAVQQVQERQTFLSQAAPTYSQLSVTRWANTPTPTRLQPTATPRSTNAPTQASPKFISFQAAHSETGNPVNGVSITSNLGYSCTTNEHGRCYIQVYISGTYTVKASKAGFKTAEKTVTVSDSSIDVVMPMTPESTQSTPSPSGNAMFISVQVHSSANNPLKDVFINIDNGYPGTCNTNEYGRCYVRVYTSKTYKVKASKTGFTPVEKNVTVSGTSVDVPFTLVPTGVSPSQLSINVTTKDINTDAIVSGVAITARHSSNTTTPKCTTDSSGKCALALTAAGKYEVFAIKDGYQDASKVVDIISTQNLVFQLKPNGQSNTTPVPSSGTVTPSSSTTPNPTIDPNATANPTPSDTSTTPGANPTADPGTNPTSSPGTNPTQNPNNPNPTGTDGGQQPTSWPTQYPTINPTGTPNICTNQLFSWMRMCNGSGRPPGTEITRIGPDTIRPINPLPDDFAEQLRNRIMERFQFYSINVPTPNIQVPGVSGSPVRVPTRDGRVRVGNFPTIMPDNPWNRIRNRDKNNTTQPGMPGSPTTSSQPFFCSFMSVPFLCSGQQPGTPPSSNGNRPQIPTPRTPNINIPTPRTPNINIPTVRIPTPRIPNGSNPQPTSRFPSQDSIRNNIPTPNVPQFNR
jgi:hypothetical protein